MVSRRRPRAASQLMAVTYPGIRDGNRGWSSPFAMTRDEIIWHRVLRVGRDGGAGGVILDAGDGLTSSGHPGHAYEPFRFETPQVVTEELP